MRSGPAFKTLSKREVLKILMGNLTYFMKLRCKQTLNFPAKYDIYPQKLITSYFRRDSHNDLLAIHDVLE